MKYVSARNIVKYLVIPLVLSALLYSCGRPSTLRSGDDLYTSNTKASVSAGYDRIFKDNPVILSGNPSIEARFDLSQLLRPEQDFITNNTTLTASCYNGIDKCFSVTSDKNIEPFTNPDTKWAFPVTSSEFLQVNLFGHLSITINKFHKSLVNHFQNVASPTIAPTNTVNSRYPTSLPSNLFGAKSHWIPNKELIAYADSKSESVKDNASFSASTFEIHMGFDSIFKEVKMSQDNTVAYHEVGHAYADILMNQRNVAEYERTKTDPSPFVYRSSFGYKSYDEARAMNEGISDFFSYYVNQRTHFGEWSLGRFLDGSRPMREDDPLHKGRVSLADHSRLSYPSFLTYDPNDPSRAVEVVHAAGMIISHYLTALSEDLMSKCSLTRASAIDLTFNILTEAMAELGDLTSKGNDFHEAGEIDKTYVNMNPALSEDWLRAENPITYRKMAQRMAKYLKWIVVDNKAGACPANNFSSSYTTDSIEQLLDKYGLLLFNTYNEDGDGDIPAFFTGLTQVNGINRIKTEMISKSLLKVDVRSEFSTKTIFDGQKDIVSIVQGPSFLGSLSNLTDAELGFNNGNNKVSPGEVVGLYVNLYNESNSQLANPKILATDWAYMLDDKPCMDLADKFPTADQGGVVCAGSPVTSANFTDPARRQPVCMMEFFDGSSTQLLSQQKYFEAMKLKEGLTKNDCLDSGDTRTCFIKALRGLDTAQYVSINPRSNWLETISEEDGTPDFSSGNIVFFEINKHISIGTNVVCKLRTTFTNCDSCNNDPNSPDKDDYEDWQYGTETPFNIINISFQVQD